MMLFEYGDDCVAIDCGLMFPAEDMLGVDLVIPDINYVIDNRKNLHGIFITHGHEDHTGALPYILRQINVPVYATPLAHGLISVKLKEARLLQSTDLREIRPGESVEAGPFTLEPFQVAHSIPDSVGYAIRTPLGTCIHTGDFKLDHTPVMGQATDLSKLAQYGDEGVLLLCADSTYAEIPGYTPSEQIVGDSLFRFIAKADGRVIVTTFASLIARVQQVFDAAAECGRRVFITGRSVHGAKMRAFWRCRDGWLNFVIYGGEAGRHTNRQLVAWMEERGMAPAFLREIDWSRFAVTQLAQAEVDRLEAPIGEFLLTLTKAEFLEGAIRRGMLGYPVSTVADIAQAFAVRGAAVRARCETDDGHAGRDTRPHTVDAVFDHHTARRRNAQPLRR